MMSRLITPLALSALLGLPAIAQQGQRVDQPGEALAWTVAAYASCETTEELQRDFREEVAKRKADTAEIIDALHILVDANGTCELLSTYAADMLELSVTDQATFEARLAYAEEPPVPVFEIEQPEGAGETPNTVILTAANEPPPQSSSNPATSSDYQD